MERFTSFIDILKLLDKSNCGKCGKPTCLVFSTAVFKGESRLDECPKLSREVVERYPQLDADWHVIDGPGNDAMQELRQKTATIDLAQAAERLGADYTDGRLTIKCLGKDFSVDTAGNIITDIHVNPWIVIPALTYIVEGKGLPVSGTWVTFRELDGAENRYPLFAARCERPLQQIADSYQGLFEDMLQIFNGKHVDYHYPADISIMLQPLPLVPMMICYSGGDEDGMESSLALFFDSTVSENLGLEPLFTLGTGLVMMFEKIAARHGRNLAIS